MTPVLGTLVSTGETRMDLLVSGFWLLAGPAVVVVAI